MARFHGKIGFIGDTKETAPGVYEPEITEKDYTGEIIRNTLSWETGEHLNDNPALGNRFKIVADTYANENAPQMRYILWNGTKWKITSIEVARPALILTVGGVYNG